MRILIYKDNLSTGRGADHLVSAIAGGLARRGHEVTLMTCVRREAFSFPLDEAVHVLYADPEQVRGETRGFDVCIATGSNEMRSLTDNGHCPPPIRTVLQLMVAPRGFFKWKRIVRNYHTRRAFDLADVAVLQFASYEAEFRRYAKHPPVRAIGEWADVKPPPEGLFDSDRPKVILYPAAINRRKNQALLIRAFALLAKRFPDWQVHVYGAVKNAYGETCRKLAKKLGVGDSVRFFGFTKDLPSVYAGASILAFPSLLEGFPMTMVEGACYGLPTVATEALPGVTDMVSEGETGLITAATPHAFAEGLAKLMADRDLCRRLGRGAADRVKNMFSRERVMNDWQTLLNELVPTGPCGRGERS